MLGDYRTMFVVSICVLCAHKFPLRQMTGCQPEIKQHANQPEFRLWTVASPLVQYSAIKGIVRSSIQPINTTSPFTASVHFNPVLAVRINHNHEHVYLIFLTTLSNIKRQNHRIIYSAAAKTITIISNHLLSNSLIMNWITLNDLWASYVKLVREKKTIALKPELPTKCLTLVLAWRKR